MKRYWLMKSEPDTYGIEHLKKDKKTPWEGVRNFQARNYMQEMNVGDTVLFYHSSCPVPGIYGLAKVAAVAHPDASQFDPKSPYYESKATKEKPLWYCVDVTYVKTLKEPITLVQLKSEKKLKTMKTLQPGSRLSVTPITAVEFAYIERLTT